MRSNQHHIVARPIFPKMTFADLEGKPLVFLNDNRPFRRYLCLHAQITRLAVIARELKNEPLSDIIQKMILISTSSLKFQPSQSA
jgi:hypothetical protein